MNRLLAAAFVAVLGLSVAGCDDPFATLQTIGQGISLTTKSVANPVTRQDEAAVELALDTGVKALLAYKTACVRGVADVHCAVNVAQIQVYTTKMKPLVNQLRGFVDNNDQINASVIYNELTALYTNVKNFAAGVGVNVGSI